MASDRERSEAANRRRRKEQSEAEFEAEMNIRIVTESALIRAGWSEQERRTRTVQKEIAVEVREARKGVARHNGIDFSN